MICEIDDNEFLICQKYFEISLFSGIYKIKGILIKIQRNKTWTYKNISFNIPSFKLDPEHNHHFNT